MITENENKQITMQIYSSKEQALRETQLVPSRSWNKDPKDGLLGCAVRYCSYEASAENVYHILEVATDSPAEMAGLVAFTDYIIGSPHTVLRKETDLYELVEQHMDQPLRLYVYNSDYDITREVIIMPNHAWGGEGSLGCGVGFGYLHRIPKVKRERQEEKETAPSESNGYPVEYDENEARQSRPRQMNEAPSHSSSSPPPMHNGTNGNQVVIPSAATPSINSIVEEDEEEDEDEDILEPINDNHRQHLSMPKSPDLYLTTEDGQTSPVGELGVKTT